MQAGAGQPAQHLQGSRGSSCHQEMGRQLPGPPPRAVSSRAKVRADCTAAGVLSEEQVRIAAEPRIQWGTPQVCLGKMGA